MSDTKQEPAPIIPFTFTCPLSQLRAMTLFASTDETRYVINGVLVEVTNTQTLLVSTNGRALAVLKLDEPAALLAPLEAEGKTLCIIPAAFIRRAYQVFRSEYVQVVDDGDTGNPDGETETITVDPAVTVTLNEKGELLAEGPDYILRCMPIIGNYPNWRIVIPSTPRGSGTGHANINPMYVKQFVQAAEILCRPFGMGTLCIRTHEGTDNHGQLAPYTIRIPRVDFFGVLMPMKISDPKCPEQESTPDWLK